jgi:hypothetical protein
MHWAIQYKSNIREIPKSYRGYLLNTTESNGKNNKKTFTKFLNIMELKNTLTNPGSKNK